MRKLNYFSNKPKAPAIDVDAYLSRLKIRRDEPSLPYLRKLHSAHIHQIPFENLDIHYNRKIILDYRKIFKKIILDGRGGFCYELNGLFYHLLDHLGYDCIVISAQMKNEDGYDKEYGHMAISVRILDQTWLVDVGFGNAFSYPKLLEAGKVQMDYTTYWRFEKDPDENFILQYSFDASIYHTKYLLKLEEKQLIQFMEMCEYHQMSPLSRFTQGKLITIKSTEGRITLTDRKLKITRLGETRESPILNEDEFLSKLDQYFSISYKDLLPVNE